MEFGGGMGLGGGAADAGEFRFAFRKTFRGSRCEVVELGMRHVENPTILLLELRGIVLRDGHDGLLGFRFGGHGGD